MRNRLLENSPLLKLAVFMMAGIVVGHYVMVLTPLQLLLLLAVAVFLALMMRRNGQLQSLAICVCFAVLGWFLTVWHKTSEPVWPEEKVVYEAVVTSRPIENPKTMAIDVVLIGSGHTLKCYLYKDGRSKSLKIGDGLKIQSRIENGRTFVTSWDWQRSHPTLSSLSVLTRTRLFFLKLRSRLLERFDVEDADDDAYAVVAAMTLGDKSALTKELKDTYAITGASHVLALSGLHLGIIYMLLSFLTVGHRWQTMTQIFIVMSVWLFVFLVGMSSSVVRSAIMLSVYALLQLGYREKMSINTLAFTAIVMLMANPLSLFDVGFQMSFMAVFFILLFMPLFNELIAQKNLMSHRVVKWFWSIFAVSCAAQIGVAPLIAYYFGRFSTYFLLTNLIVLPAAMLILYLSLVVLLIPSFAYLLLYIVSRLNAALIRIASMPYASIEDLHPSIMQVVMIYVIILAGYILMERLLRIKALPAGEC